MTQFVTNIIQNSLSGFVDGAVKTAGGYAGDAIVGVGNFVERQGNAIGNGIANKFDGRGQGLSGYGGVKKPTAATAVSKVDTTKSGVGSKPLGSTPTAKKVLPVAPSTQRKALPAPAKASTARPQTRRANSGPTVSKSKPATTQSKTGYSEPKTNAAGKVVIQKQSLPQSKQRNSSTPNVPKHPPNNSYKGPLPVTEKTVGGNNKSQPQGGYNGPNYKPHGGYQGPLNLGGLGDAGSKSASQAKSAVSNTAGKVTGGQSKPGGGGYQGPLSLGSLS